MSILVLLMSLSFLFLVGSWALQFCSDCGLCNVNGPLVDDNVTCYYASIGRQLFLW